MSCYAAFSANAADRKQRLVLAGCGEGVFLFRTNIAFVGPLSMTGHIFSHEQLGAVDLDRSLERR
jgi:hypothetical protein